MCVSILCKCCAFFLPGENIAISKDTHASSFEVYYSLSITLSEIPQGWLFAEAFLVCEFILNELLFSYERALPTRKSFTALLHICPGVAILTEHQGG